MQTFGTKTYARIVVSDRSQRRMNIVAKARYSALRAGWLRADSFVLQS